ncbi:hypothetical protein ACX0HA_07105 [Flavobacterium hauense]
MRKHILLLSLLSLSAITWSCSNDVGNDVGKDTTAVVKKTVEMTNFEKSFAVNAKKFERGEINGAEHKKLTLENAKKYLKDNNEAIKAGATDFEIISQALDLNLAQIKKLNSKN